MNKKFKQFPKIFLIIILTLAVVGIFSGTPLKGEDFKPFPIENTGKTIDIQPIKTYISPVFGWHMENAPWEPSSRTISEIAITADAGIGWTLLTYIDREAPIEYLNILKYCKERNIDIVQIVPVKGFDPSGKINMLDPTIHPTKDLARYYNDLRSYVRKYKNYIQFWMLRIEMTTQWGGTPEDMVIMQRLSYRAIKEEDPDAKVVLGAFFAHQYFPEIGTPFELTRHELGWASRFIDDLKLLEDIEKNPNRENKFKKSLTDREYALLTSKDNFDHYFDIVGLDPGLVAQENYVKRIPEFFAQRGYIGIPIWQTDNWPEGPKSLTAEGGFGMAIPKDLDRPGGFDELGLAQFLISRVVAALPYVDRVTINVNIRASVTGHEKLVYWAYRKLIDKLSGFTSAKKIAEGQYRFDFTDKGPIYVVWNPYLDTKKITLNIEKSGKFEVTQLIPDVPTGRSVRSYKTGFKSERLDTTGKTLNLSTSKTPLLVEVVQ